MNFRYDPDEQLQPSGVQARAKANLSAIRLLQDLEASNRQPDSEEQRTLAAYSGWGALSQVFDERRINQRRYSADLYHFRQSPEFAKHENWEKQFGWVEEELQDLLTEEEFSQARGSVNNAHYTSPTVCHAIWQTAQHLGFQGGRVFEAGIGTGLIQGAAPAELDGKLEVTGVELDSITARIAAQLQPDAEIQHTNISKAIVEPNAYDLVVANVPFHEVGPFDPNYPRLNLHNYCIARSLDALKPGGIAVMLTSRYTLDGNISQREFLAEKADLVGAMRLPDGTFRANAGTDVVTDLLVLRKPLGVKRNSAWVPVEDLLPFLMGDDQEEHTKPHPRNVYYREHPEMILGDEVTSERSQYRPNDYSVRGDAAALPARLDAAIANLPKDLLVERQRSFSGSAMGWPFVVATAPDPAVPIAEGGVATLLHVDDPNQVPKEIGPVFSLSAAQLADLSDTPTAVELLKVAEPLADGNVSELIGDALDLAETGNLVPSHPAFAHVDQAAKKLGYDGIVHNKLTARVWNADVITNPTREVTIALAHEADATYVERDGDVCYVDSRELKSAEMSAKKLDVARSYIGVRDDYLKLLRAQAEPLATDEQIDGLRASLNKSYDVYFAKYGSLNARNSPARHLIDDLHYFPVTALEDTKRVQTSGGKTKLEVVKAPIFTERTVAALREPEVSDSLTDAITTSLGWRGKLDVPWMAELLNEDRETVGNQLLEGGYAFEDPVSGQFMVAEAYLAGNVVKRLTEAQAVVDRGNEQFARNVEALAKVQPERIPIDEIAYRLGCSWIRPRLIEQFAEEVLGLGLDVRFIAKVDRWKVTPEKGGSQVGVGNTETYGSLDMPGYKILETMLNLGEPIVKKRVEDGDGNTTLVLDPKATAQAGMHAEKLEQAFHRYIDEVPKRVEEIEDAYNSAFNVHVEREFDGAHLAMPGLSNQFRRMDHQLSAVWRCMQEGHGLLAHQVGAGKTITQIMAAMEMKRTGLAEKPLLVVDNATVTQFAATFRAAYPNAKVLCADDKNFVGAKRQRFLAQAANGNWDAVILPHSSFDLIPVRPEAMKDYYAKIISDYREAALEAGDDKITVKQLESAAKRIEAKRDKLEEQLRKKQDFALCFEDLGFDALFLDEAHKYKKVPFATKLGRVRGVDTTESQRALSAHIKIRGIQAKTGGRNVILATGTPVTNTMAEAWNMVRLASPHLIKEFNVQTFDRFAATFGRVETQPELNEASGRWRMISRFSKFANGPELIRMIRGSWDVYIGDKVDLDVPDLRGKAPEKVILPLSPANKQINEMILGAYKKYEDMSGLDKKEYSYVPLMLMGVGVAASLDPRLVAPHLPDDPNSRLNMAADRIHRIWQDSEGVKGTQAVFADRYRPMNTAALDRLMTGDFGDIEIEGDDAPVQDEDAGAFNLYDDLREKLVERGIPAEEIALVGDYNLRNERQAKSLFGQVNEGDIRVLIGSTAKMGVGVNIQKKLVALHELDPPRSMTPADQEQRHGRIIRQGNTNKEVEILQYGMKRTADAGVFHRIETKAKFISQILTGRGNLREFDDPASGVTQSLADMKAELTGDHRVVRQVELGEAVRGLRLQRSGFYDQVRTRVNRIYGYERDIERITQTDIPECKTAIAAVAKMDFEEPFTIELNGKSQGDLTKSKVVDVVGKVYSGLEGEVKKATGASLQALQKSLTINLNGVELKLSARASDMGGSISRSVVVLPSHQSSQQWGEDGIHTAKVRGGNELLTKLRDLPDTTQVALNQKESSLRQREEILTGLRLEPSEWSDEDKLAKMEEELQKLTADLLENPDAPDVEPNRELATAVRGLVKDAIQAKSKPWDVAIKLGAFMAENALTATDLCRMCETDSDLDKRVRVASKPAEKYSANVVLKPKEDLEPVEELDLDTLIETTTSAIIIRR